MREREINLVNEREKRVTEEFFSRRPFFFSSFVLPLSRFLCTTLKKLNQRQEGEKKLRAIIGTSLHNKLTPEHVKKPTTRRKQPDELRCNQHK